MSLPESTSPSPVVIQGDARNLILPDESVDLIVTLPPYFGLRSYKDGGEHYEGQIGDERTPLEFVNALLECTREWMRVLQPEGSIWVNLGDKYNSGSGAGPQSGLQGGDARTRGNGRGSSILPKTNLAQKTLLGIPWRYALGCIDDLGLILRAEVIWSKPNGLPESVRDRVRRSHETWFHFVKQPKYFAAVDEIREEFTEPQRHGVLTWAQRQGREDQAARYSDQNGHGGTAGVAQNPLGKLPGSVWAIATQPLRVPEALNVDHFAAFPMEFPRRIILGWSPSGICVECGDGRRPVVDVQKTYSPSSSLVTALTKAHGQDGREGARPSSIAQITGYTCACPEPTAPTDPAVVLDPFGGTGTVALVASVLGRRGISVDLSADYGRIAQWRTTDPKQRARAATVPKPRRSPEETA